MESLILGLRLRLGLLVLLLLAVPRFALMSADVVMHSSP